MNLPVHVEVAPLPLPPDASLLPDSMLPGGVELVSGAPACLHLDGRGFSCAGRARQPGTLHLLLTHPHDCTLPVLMQVVSFNLY